MHAFRSLQYCIDQKVQGLNVMGLTEETVPPVPDDFWAYSIDAPPPAEIQYEMGAVFPDWVRAMESHIPMMEEGPTRVGTQGGVDPDSIDVAKLLADLDSQGYGHILDDQVDEKVFGVPIIKSVEQALRMAAMYDLYIELRLSRAPKQAPPRKLWKVLSDPAWIMLGLELGTVAGQAATDVLRASARKKKRLSVSELAELIRKNERV